MSILTSIKKLLGIAEDDTSFDEDIIMQINAVLLGLSQFCEGPTTSFFVTDKTDDWSLFGITDARLSAIKIYIYNKVKMAFDPPANSFVLDAMMQQTAEIEWRLNITPDPVEEETI